MKKLILPVIACCLIFSAPDPVQAQQTLTLTTFYPAPYGAYDRIKLVPRAALACANPGDDGVMYIDQADGDTYVCMAGEARRSSGEWTFVSATDSIYPSDTASNPNINVGIGWLNPEAKLHVVGSAIIHDDLLGNRIIIGSGQTAGSLGGEIYYDGVGDGFRIQGHHQGTTWKDIFLDPMGGNVGIATTNPQGLLDVNALFTVKSTGRVGIGTTNPPVQLTVEGINNPMIQLRSTDNSATQLRLVTNSTNRRIVAINNAGIVQSQIIFGDSGAIKFTGQTTPANDTMTIDANGNVGIGITTPQNDLDITGTLHSSGTLWTSKDGIKGEIKLQWVDAPGFADDGYYAVYAP